MGAEASEAPVNSITRNRKFRLAVASLVVASVAAAVMEYVAFWLLVETLIDKMIWQSVSCWILGWWLAADAGVLTLYGGQNVIAKWAPAPGDG